MLYSADNNYYYNNLNYLIDHSSLLRGFSGTMKEIILMNITALRTQLVGRQTSWLFTIMAEELNSRLPRTTPASA